VTGKKIPRYEDREDEAAFWQRTSLDDLDAGELERASLERQRRPLSTTFAIRLDPRTVDHLRQLAASQGLGATQLVRRWVFERIRIERAAGALARKADEDEGLESLIRQRVVDQLMAQIPAAVEAATQEVIDRAAITSYIRRPKR
jgi:hypothetical protein